MHDLERQIDGLHPKMAPYGGKPAIRLVAFLATLRHAFYMVGSSEAAAVSVLT